MICFGFGIGYHIESILQMSGGNIRLACVEPDASILEIPEVKKKNSRFNTGVQIKNSKLEVFLYLIFLS